MKCADFIGMLFLARDVTHSVHLNTRSYSKHKALGKFYDEIVDLADNFAEAYQGKHGLIGPISLMNAGKTSNILDFMQDQVDEIEKSGMKCAVKMKPRCKILLMKLSDCT